MALELTQEEEDLICEIAYQEERMITRLKPETLLEKANLFRPRMVKTATNRKLMTYSELTHDFHDLAWQDMGQVLGLMGLLEDRMGRPLLPAIVVNATSSAEGSKGPGDNYFGLVKKANQYGEVPPESDAKARQRMWENHRSEVWEFDWER